MTNQIFRFSGYLEPEEVRTIIQTIPLVSKHSERDQLLVETLWQTGARVTEALTLVPERIGMTSVVLRNLKQAKSLKGQNGKVVRDMKGKVSKIRDESAVKEVEVSESLCQKLKDFCNQYKIMPGEWVFRGNRNPTKHLTREYVWKMLTQTSEKAQVFRFGKRNLRTGGRFKGAYPHILRHSSAMYLLDQIGDITVVKEQLGHANISTTQGYAFARKPRIKRLIREIQW